MADKIGKYEIVRTIARGGMGVVYEGYDRVIERRVAVKTILPDLSSSAEAGEFGQRFQREAQAAARCSHPNLVTVFEYGTDQGTPFMAMEYVDGDTLEHCAKREALTLKQVLVVARDTLKGLNAAHAAGIVHRDIKPANIMLLADRSACKLADFGIAKLDSDAQLTQVGSVIGTERYMSPEQASAFPIDHRSDLFSLGIMLIELAQRAKTPPSVPLQSMGRVGRMHSGIRLDFQQPIPAALIPMLTTAIAHSPDQRFDSARTMARALKAAVGRLRNPPDLPSARSDLPVTEVRGSVESNLASSRTHRPSQSNTTAPGVRSHTSEDRLLQFREEAARLLGNDAGRAIDELLDECISFAEVVYGVAEQIKETRTRNRFLGQWLA